MLWRVFQKDYHPKQKCFSTACRRDVMAECYSFLESFITAVLRKLIPPCLFFLYDLALFMKKETKWDIAKGQGGGF